jgi:hypothetical protein
LVLCLPIASPAWAGDQQKLATKPGAGVATPASSAPSDTSSWMNGLPKKNAVLAAYPASEPATYARQEAAFAVLADYIEIRAGVDQSQMGAAIIASLPPQARASWKEYVGSGYSKTLTNTNGSFQYFANPAFRAEVVTRLISHDALVAYETARNRKPGVVGPAKPPYGTTGSGPVPLPMTRTGPDATAPLTHAQYNDPEVLAALPHAGGEVPAMDWMGMPPAARWVEELPSVGRVSALMRDGPSADGALRERDALEMLITFVHALGPQLEKEVDRGQPRERLTRYVLQKRWLDKQGLYSAADAKATTSAAAARRKAVRDRVLNAFFSAPSKAAYRATPEYDAPAREFKFAQRGESLAPELDKDKTKGVDRKVFGIPLGEQLRLPVCATVLHSSTTCIDQTGQFLTTLQDWGESFAPGRAPVKIGSEVTVLLADQACPDWVKAGNCRVQFTVDGGYALAAHFWTGDNRAEGTIKKKLEEKYGVPGKSEGKRECTNRLTGMIVKSATDWSWSRDNAIYVFYSPLGGDNCERGAVQIETGTYHRLRDAAVARHEASDPKL